MTFVDYRQPATIRTAAILTDSYVAGNVLGAESSTVASPADIARVNEYNQLILYVAFTKGSLTSAEFKVEFSPDNSTFYQESAMLIAGGTITDSVAEHTITATGNYRIAIPMNDRYVRVSAKGTGTVTNSSMGITAILGVN